uniref:G domain-containing protein n=1 Tax=Rhodosorus marinus TaxID=101924 RepID=A0A7S2ZSX2_9RHOD|mmetsp:Transcript_29933/g.114947  ORF Transcript_29933/g.114947 Transcript_29933/m.114947 type:complete len:412 (+) Transcript_29933:475-1710(+)
MRGIRFQGEVTGWLRLWTRDARVWPVRCVHIRRVPEKTDRGIREDVKRKSKPKSENDFVETGLSLALVGKPNVGKSTIYNRLVDSAAVRGHKSIVHPEPGVTRDVIYGEAVLHDLRFLVFDTAGLEESIVDTKARAKITSFFDIKAVSGLMAMDDSEIYRALYRDMALKTALAVEKADAVLHVVDAREGMSEVDKDIARWLLSIHKPDRLVLVANKYDSKLAEQNFHDFYELGLGEPVPLAAAQGLGLADLYTRLSGVFEYRLKEKAELQLIDDPSKAVQTEANAPSQGSESGLDQARGNSPELAADSKKMRLEVERKREKRTEDEKKTTQFVEEKELDVDLPNLVHGSEKWQQAMDDTERDILVSIVGRPNVGKSTLVNKLIGKVAMRSLEWFRSNRFARQFLNVTLALF